MLKKGRIRENKVRKELCKDDCEKQEKNKKSVLLSNL